MTHYLSVLTHHCAVSVFSVGVFKLHVLCCVQKFW